VCRIRCSVSEPDRANLIEPPPRGSKLLGWPGSESQPRNPTIPRVRLSKIKYYHPDNLSTIRLSDVKYAVNKKRRFGRVVCALANDATMGATSSSREEMCGAFPKETHTAASLSRTVKTLSSEPLPNKAE
jgi:hypothetical protein